MKSKLLPVLFAFFIMGFCDVVGIATSYVQNDFNLSESVAGLIPSAVFLWFFLISIPAAGMMNRIGRKNMVQLSNVVTFIGMAVPFIHYDLPCALAGFALLGIGNTLLQVSLNPLLTNVTDGKSLTSALTAGQVVKAVSSFCGPFIAMAALTLSGRWQALFPVYAVLTLISLIWLQCTEIPADPPAAETDSIGKTFALLSDRNILRLFIGIVCVVGLDVAMNTVSPKLLMERGGLPLEKAALASSVYFFCRTAGAFVGTVLLVKIDALRYFRCSISVALCAIILLFFAARPLAVLIAVGVTGFTCSSIFSIIFSEAIRLHPDRVNGISGLMITGLVGGAATPPLMGLLADQAGTQNGSLVVVVICALYLLVCSFRMVRS